LKKYLFLLLISLFIACQRKVPPVPLVKTANYRKAEAFLYRQNDSAYYYFNEVAGSRDSLQAAMAYNQMAVLQSESGDYFGSQESLLSSLRFLNPEKERDHACLASDYNELGLTSMDLRNYERAIACYDSAAHFSNKELFKLVVSNNKALALAKKGDYVRAIRLYRSVLERTPKNTKEYARTLSNMARTQWLYRPGYNAAPQLWMALRIREREKDLWGQNASYAHLADYYTLKEPDSALFYARQMYGVARQLNSPDDRLEALQKLIRLGQPRESGWYFTIYRQLEDSVQAVRGAARNQFALIRYDAQKNKSDNLRLQKDNAVGRLQVLKRNIIIALIFLMLAGGLPAAYFWYRKRKRTMELEARNAVQENQLKLSKKVHDVVANGLYRMMSEVENQEQLDKDILLDRIETLYERSRDISYEAPQQDYPHFHKKIAGLLLSFATAHTKVVLVGNDEIFWDNIHTQARQELEIILQELMVNMKKHSQAGNVLIRFEKRDETAFIDYSDDGVGMAAGIPHNNGLKNTGNRIKGMQGQLIFDPQPGKGLHVQLSCPIV
jgi:tetratricopeptide (TPR) repeat protein